MVALDAATGRELWKAERKSDGVDECEHSYASIQYWTGGVLVSHGNDYTIGHDPKDGAELWRLGYELESFGASAIKVTAVPALLDVGDSAKALLALAHDLEGLDRGADLQAAIQRIAATTACHAAVKANYPLSYEKMTHILEELRATAYSTVCPHGRPVMLRLTRREIEKNFERI